MPGLQPSGERLLKILVVDRDDITAQMIAARLEPVGHTVTHEPAKNVAPERLASGQHELIFVDPSPLTGARQLILNLRRSVPKYPYVVLMGHEGTPDGAVRESCNDFLAKPIDPEEVDRKVENAQRLIKLILRIRDEKEDFPSAGGVIAKSAFNQLFLSAIDRADRYGESTYLLLITLNNYTHITSHDGQSAGDYAAAALSKYLVNLRRQSDIIGQTARNEFALLLQRPQFPNEPLEAAARFAEALGKDGVFAGTSNTRPELKVSLIDLPKGDLRAEHIIQARV